MDKLSKKLDKFYTQIQNKNKSIKSTTQDQNDSVNTSIDIQINQKKQQKNQNKKFKNLMED